LVTRLDLSESDKKILLELSFLEREYYVQ